MNKPIPQPESQVNSDWVAGLELIDSKVYPLAGAMIVRPGSVDSRLSKRQPMIAGGESVGPKHSDKICYYEHVATAAHRPTGMYFVAFRQTMDALLLEQQNPEKFPEWLMKDPRKQTELSIHIYRVKSKPTNHMTSHEDWLEEIGEAWVFDSVSYFLLHQKIFQEEALQWNTN